MIDLSIIIVSYNTKDFLKKCIESIINTSKNLEYEIIVVDNNSTDGTKEIVQSSNFKVQTSKLKVIENKENVGFAKANNIGIKEAKGKYLLFLNPDTIVRPQALEEMVAFIRLHPEAGAATCRVELFNGKLDDACHRGFPTPWNAFCHFTGLPKIFPRSRIFADYSLGWMDLSKIHEIDACAGAFMMVRKEAGQQIDWWNEDYFWYGEDIDFCYRLKEKGWRIFYVPTVSIAHYKGVAGGIKKISTSISTADYETKRHATDARFEAMRIFYTKHYKNKYPQIITWLTFRGIEFLQNLAYRLLK